MSETDEIAAFIAARLAEDEALARDRLCINCRNPTLPLRSALGVTGYTHGRHGTGNGDAWQGVRCPSRFTGAEPVQNPARALREVEAKRRMLTDVVAQIDDMDARIEGEWGIGYSPTGESGLLLKLLALPYSDHPDYKAEEWKP